MDMLKQSLTCVESPESLNSCPDASSLTALALLVLNTNPEPEAAKLLLEAGADVFGGNGDFHTCPMGQALKYDCLAELEIMLVTLKEEGWRKLMVGVMSPPDITGGGVGVAGGVWVYVNGKRAKTVVDVMGFDTGKEATVTYDDGTQGTVPASEIQPLPSVPAASKALLLKVAEAASCGVDIMAPLRLLEEGHYGTTPRGWGKVAVLAGGAMGVQAFQGLDGLEGIGGVAAAGGAAVALGF
jgi:hypothetical protein